MIMTLLFWGLHWGPNFSSLNHTGQLHCAPDDDGATAATTDTSRISFMGLAGFYGFIGVLTGLSGLCGLYNYGFCKAF